MCVLGACVFISLLLARLANLQKIVNQKKAQQNGKGSFGGKGFKSKGHDKGKGHGKYHGGKHHGGKSDGKGQKRGHETSQDNTLAPKQVCFLDCLIVTSMRAFACSGSR